MSLKNDILTAIQQCAEAATGGTELLRGYLKLGFGTPGTQFQFKGATRDKGQAYNIPGSIDCTIEGIATVLLAASNVLEGVKNDGGSSVSVGHLVRISGNNEARRATSTDDAWKFLGFAKTAAATGLKFDVFIGNKALVKIAAGLTPSAGELLYPTASAGVVSTAVLSSHVGKILDASMYADPGNLFVMALVKPLL